MNHKRWLGISGLRTRLCCARFGARMGKLFGSGCFSRLAI